MPNVELLGNLVTQAARRINHVGGPVEIGMPISTEGAHMAKAYDAESVLAHSGDPSPLSAKVLLAKRQYAALLRKNGSLPDSNSEERTQLAMSKWQSARTKNVETGIRLLNFQQELSEPCLMHRVFERARLELFRLLGPGPSEDDWESFDRGKIMSGGSVQGLVNQPYGRDVDPYVKLDTQNTITASSECLKEFGSDLINGPYRAFLVKSLEEGDLKIQECDFSKVVTVPKDAVIDRVIAIEPSINLMAQHGMAAMLGRYCSKWGITLHAQQYNQKLALKASELGFHPDGFATLDLSSASDSITVEFVERMIPVGWRVLLDAARTKYVKVEGSDELLLSLSYSTMGNAFTFPLQCLLFEALTRASLIETSSYDYVNVGKNDEKRAVLKEHQVYGDDIIVPLSAAGPLMEVLNFCGFELNQEKSFITGFFRESCGGDYLGGIDVKPAYLRGDISYPTERYRLFNAVQRLDSDHSILDELYNSFPVHKRCIGPALGPYIVGDPGNSEYESHGVSTSHIEAPVWWLLRNKAKSRVSIHWDNNLQSYKVRWTGLFPRSRKVKRHDSERRYLCCLAGSYGLDHSVRGTVEYRPHVRWTSTPWIAMISWGGWYVN